MSDRFGRPEQSMERVLAVVVLYRMSAEESPAYVSFRKIQRETAATALEARTQWELMVCDNTPCEQAAPADFAGVYLRETGNPGLAAGYNAALAKAESDGHRWLMLLDQDTQVTAAYVDEVLLTLASVVDQVVALVPKLEERGTICSPAEPPVWGAPRAVARETVGTSGRRLIAFNSGAVVRVAALRAIGGFATEFPLDYLDHATFAALQDRGGLLYVLRASLPHELSSNTERVDAAAARRQESVLAAERRFYARYGTLGQRGLRRVRLLKAACGRMVRGREGGQTWRMIKSALWP